MDVENEVLIIKIAFETNRCCTFSGGDWKSFFKVLSFENHGREPFLMLKERPGTITNRWKRGGIVLKIDPMRKRKKVKM